MPRKIVDFYWHEQKSIGYVFEIKGEENGTTDVDNSRYLYIRIMRLLSSLIPYCKGYGS